jgi:hypothetical protein
MESLSRKRITDIVTETALRYFARNGYSVYPEVGIQSGGNLRADVLAMNMKGKVTIIEVKSCWQDFATDKKWINYLPYCNKFYFCIPYHLFNSEKGQFIKTVCQENKIGLFVVGHNKQDYVNLTKDENGHWTTKQTVWMYSVKGCTSTKVSGDIRKWLFTKLAWRGGISKATLGTASVSMQVTEKYDFDKPLSEQQFLYTLDILEQKRYLKAFPKSSFKKILKDPSVCIKLDQIKQSKLKEIE